MAPDPSREFLRSGVDIGSYGDIRTDEDVEMTYEDIRKRRRGFRYARSLRVIIPVRPTPKYVLMGSEFPSPGYAVPMSQALVVPATVTT